MAQKARISYKKVCPNCGFKPAWYLSYDIIFNAETKEIVEKPIYSCGDCSFKLPRKEK